MRTMTSPKMQLKTSNIPDSGEETPPILLKEMKRTNISIGALIDFVAEKALEKVHKQLEDERKIAGK